VGSLLHNTTLLYHGYVVRITYGGKAMSHHNCGPSHHDLIQGILHNLF
jgi:hypothetical protein